MTTQIISLDKLPQVLTDFAERFPEDALRAIRQTARESRAILAKTTSDTKPFSPIDTGAYMRAWQGIPHEEGADIIHIQTDTMRFECSYGDFFSLATTILVAEKNLKIIKVLK